METKVAVIKFIHYYGVGHHFLYPKNYHFRLNKCLAKRLKKGDVIHLPDNHGKNVIAKIIDITTMSCEKAQQYSDLTLIEKTKKSVNAKTTFTKKDKCVVNKTMTKQHTVKPTKSKVKISIKSLRKGTSVKKN